MRIMREKPTEMARRLWETVTVTGRYRDRTEYSVLEYAVTMLFNEKTKKGWGCTCPHGSMYGINKTNETCKHIKTVQLAIKNRGALVWESK